MHYCLYFCYQFKSSDLAVFFYNIFLLLYKTGIRLAAPFNEKAAKWISGRKNIIKQLEKTIPLTEKIIWMHCSSLGEFEQGRPLIEKLRTEYPGYKFLLTFFSPSGYEVQKNYKGADWIFYLPMDGPRNAKRFLEIVHPSLVIFIKYEFWYYYLKKIRYKKIPLLLVSALFRKNTAFFKWYGNLQRKMLSRFNHLFVQNQESKNLINETGLADICTISGDTRFDRVIDIAEKFEPLPLISGFIGNNRAIIAGSTWSEDEIILQKAFYAINNPSLRLIIAPHEIHEKHLAEIESSFPGAVRFSKLTVSMQETSNVLIIDNFGMLSRLYKYAWLTYVGGGHTSNGVHNVLEAAVYKKIVLFDPVYQKYSEAVGLIKSGGGISFTDEKRDGNTLRVIIEALSNDDNEYKFRSESAGNFAFFHKGATQKILSYIQENRLLTS